MNETRMDQKRQALQSDLKGVVERVLIEHEVPESVAAIATTALRNRLADYWAGQTISFPKHYRWKLDKLELEIYDAFTGSNFDELARRHNMTERGIRILIARVRAKIASGQTDTNQLDLLGAPDEA